MYINIRPSQYSISLKGKLLRIQKEKKKKKDSPSLQDWGMFNLTDSLLQISLKQICFHFLPFRTISSFGSWEVFVLNMSLLTDLGQFPPSGSWSFSSFFPLLLVFFPYLVFRVLCGLSPPKAAAFYSAISASNHK